MEIDDHRTYSDFAINLLQNISSMYWYKMFHYIKEHKIDPKELTGFLINPEKFVISMGRTHIALEYYGSETLTEINDKILLAVEINDYSKDENEDFFEKVIGIKFDSTSNIKFPLQMINEELIIPTNRGMDKLIDLKWNFAAQNAIMGFNTGGYFIPEGQFSRLINCIFFDSNEAGLITRRVKWIDFIPMTIDETSYEDVDELRIDLSYYIGNWFNDLIYRFPMPTGFKYEKLVQANKFIEVSGSKNFTEPDITSFLSVDENKFIMTMGFCATEVHPQILCQWQSQQKDPIKPDFFIVKPNGYADIVEFKLPTLKGNSIVGITNREKFSSEIQSYIAQTRVYRDYFDDPNNRKWVEDKFGFKVYKPRRYLVVGRRYDFDSDIWQEIKSDYLDLEIITYDDLIDGVITQFYM